MTLKKPSKPSITEKITKVAEKETQVTQVQVEDASPKLAVVDGKVMVTSLELSRNFLKQHKDVLRAIVNTTNKCSAEFNQRNFAPSTYLNDQNKEQPMYNLTRDGFSMVAFGFNGTTAMAFKESFIFEFNRMERALVQQREEKLVQNQNQNRISGTDWPLWSDSAINLMQSEYLMAEPEIKNLRFAIIGYLNGVQPVGFNEAALLRLQNFFVKGFGSVLIKENEVSSFALQTPAGRYRRMMGLLSEYSNSAVAKINQALCDLGLEPV